MTTVDKPQQHPAPEGVAAPFTIAVDHQVDGNHLALTASPHVLYRLLALTGLDHYLDTAARTPTGPDTA